MSGLEVIDKDYEEFTSFLKNEENLKGKNIESLEGKIAEIETKMNTSLGEVKNLQSKNIQVKGNKINLLSRFIDIIKIKK